MNLTSVDEMYGKSFDLKDMFAMEQSWKNRAVFEMKKPRETSAFLYIDSGKLSYDIPEGAELTANEGTVVFIPKDSMYTVTFFANEGKDRVRTLLCQFQTIDDDKNSFVLFDKITAFSVFDIKEHFFDMINAYLMPNRSPSFLKSLYFGIISKVLMYAKNVSLKSSASFSSIRKGVLYLENDPLQEKTIPEIAEMCNVCESGFRRLFKQYSGYSPNEYRINEKINRAKKMLTAGNMSVEEIAIALGFNDSSYFCKLFKRRTGVTPTEYAKQY